MVSTRDGFNLRSMTRQKDSETFRFEYDQNEAPPSMAVVTAVSDVVDTVPTELVPLYDIIDTDALDALVGVRHPTNGDVHATFSFEGYAITAHSNGILEIAPLQGDRQSDDTTAEETDQ